MATNAEGAAHYAGRMDETPPPLVGVLRIVLPDIGEGDE